MTRRCAAILLAVWLACPCGYSAEEVKPREKAGAGLGAPAAAPAQMPVSAPRPNGADELSFLPPLCVEDAIALTNRADHLLAATSGPLSSRSRRAARRMIRSAIDYCEFLNDRHSSLGSYKWYRLATQKAPRSSVQSSVRLPAPVSKVTAISFSATEGDVWLISIEINEAGLAPIKRTIRRHISRDFPRTVVCYLPEATRVRSIRTTRQGWRQEARLTLYAGVTREPEYARKAIAQMQNALAAMDEGRDNEAILHLRQTRQQLRSFRNEQLRAFRRE